MQLAVKTVVHQENQGRGGKSDPHSERKNVHKYDPLDITVSISPVNTQLCPSQVGDLIFPFGIYV